jgi:hypothetical protein
MAAQRITMGVIAWLAMLFIIAVLFWANFIAERGTCVAVFRPDGSGFGFCNGRNERL